jgi:uncharacterized protein (DUF58 family)
MSFGIGFAAINTGNNLLYLLLGMMLSFIIASGILAEMSLRGLEIARHPPTHVFAGRPFLMGISLRNTKRRLPSLSIEVEDLLDDTPLDKKCYFLKIPAGRTQQTSYRHTLKKRGLYRFTGFRISTRFPFALFRKSLLIDEADELLVFPALRPVFAAPLGTGAITGEETGRLGRRGEFHGLRELRDGDDPRDIHWPTSARAGRLLVREREEETGRQATLRLDNALAADAAPSEAEALERVIAVAASLAAEYLGRGYAVRVVARGSGASLGTGTPHLLRILGFLALLPSAAPEVPFTDEGPTLSSFGVFIASSTRSGGRQAGEELFEVP